MDVGLLFGRSLGPLGVSAILIAAACGDPDAIDPPPTVPDGDIVIPDAGPATPDSGGPVMSALALERVVPDHGPFVGGQRAILRGSGFDENAFVWIGGNMVQPADTIMIDSRRLEIVTPAGDPGPADVEVEVGDDRIVLGDGYTYDRVYVDPSRGSVSGGTVVNIIGSGTAFAAGDTVELGGTACTDVEVVSETRITCRTPPMAAGTVDVTVTHALDGSETTAEDAYTYYDSTDPFGGGLGGGPLMGNLNVTVLNAGTGGPVTDAFVIVGEDLTTPNQGLTDLRGQISFSDGDLTGRQLVTAAKFCFEKTSFVAFDASEVTIFLVPWMDPMCGMGGMPPTGRGRNGSFVNGELIWLGPNEYGPNPWDNIPPARDNEVKVAYVYTTQRSVASPNPDPTLGGAVQRVLEVPPDDGEPHLGYPYRIFARPAGLAVYALAGLENTDTGEFIPYVMGIARNVLAGPGEEVLGADMIMNIPLDHTVDVEVGGLPMPARTGPDRFRVDANIDLGGEGIIVRQVNGEDLDIVRGRSTARPFRFWAQPALFDALSDGRYRISAGWYTGDFDAQPYTQMVLNGVRDVTRPIVADTFLGIPQATSPTFGERLPADRVLRWSADGPDPDLHIVLMIGGDGNPAWRHFAPGSVREAPIPDLSTIPEIDDISSGFITWVVYAVRIPGFTFETFSYAHLQERFWTHQALDYFTATR
jgi:hypothetical protein